MSMRYELQIVFYRFKCRKNKKKNARSLRTKDKDNQGRAKRQRHLVIKKKNELPDFIAL